MAWCERDHTGRALSGPERTFVEALVALLSDVRPAQLDERETALTAKGKDCLIALMPHRGLGGVAIVVWLCSHHADVTWAQVAGLGCCHDALDLGIGVKRFPLTPEHPDFGPLVAGIREQLMAPLTLRLYKSQVATVLVRDQKGYLRRVGRLGTPLNILERIWGPPAQETMVRMVDEASPPITEPSHVDEWFAAGRTGA